MTNGVVVFIANIRPGVANNTRDILLEKNVANNQTPIAITGNFTLEPFFVSDCNQLWKFRT